MITINLILSQFVILYLGITGVITEEVLNPALLIAGLTIALLVIDIINFKEELRTLSTCLGLVRKRRWFYTSLFSMMEEHSLNVKRALAGKDNFVSEEVSDITLSHIATSQISEERSEIENFLTFVPYLKRMSAAKTISLLEIEREESSLTKREFIENLLISYLREKLFAKTSEQEEFFCVFRDPFLPLNRFGYESSLFLILQSEEKFLVWWFGYQEAGCPSSAELQFLTKSFLTLCKSTLHELHYNTRIKAALLDAQGESSTKQEIIDSISHDVRSPLNNIQTILYLFKQGTPGADGPELIDTAISNCRIAGDILESVLQFSAANAGQISFNPTQFELCETLREVAHLYKIEAAKKGIAIEIVMNEKVRVYLDKAQFRRIVTNVISNAIKYTGGGKILLATHLKKNGSLQIQITDTGVGMTKDQLLRIATPFCRFRNCEEEVEGVGLGLALSQKLVKINHLEMKFDSVPGEGTTVTLTLPKQLIHHVQREVVRESRNASQVNSKPQTFERESNLIHLINKNEKLVLIVDDDIDCVESLSKVLRREGYEIVVATNFFDAVRILTEERISHLITDDAIGERDGLALVQWTLNSRTDVHCSILSGKSLTILQQKYGSIIQKFTKPVEIESILSWLSGTPLSEGELRKAM